MPHDDRCKTPSTTKVLDMPDDADELRSLVDAMENRPRNSGLPRRIDCDAKTIDKGLAKLVLSIVELLRQLLERQAVRRVDAGGLDDDQIERIGEALTRLEERMGDLKAAFGLADEDLRLDLGPVDRLLT